MVDRRFATGLRPRPPMAASRELVARPSGTPAFAGVGYRLVLGEIPSRTSRSRPRSRPSGTSAQVLGLPRGPQVPEVICEPMSAPQQIWKARTGGASLKLMRTAAAILSEALQLSDSERADLALELSKSLEQRGANDPTREDWERAWATEARARLAKIRSGESQAVPLEEAAARVREALAAKKH